MTLLLVCFVAFLVLGMPIAFVIGIAGFAYFASVPFLNFQTATQMIVAQSQSFAFLAVPFFIFAGNLMNVSGITDRLLSLARLLTRRMYGGTAQISVVMSTLMGGVSGSATADAAMETRILGPEMMRIGYKKGYICAVNCVTALITATIPPSLGLIIFGFVGEFSYQYRVNDGKSARFRRCKHAKPDSDNQNNRKEQRPYRFFKVFKEFCGA